MPKYVCAKLIYSGHFEWFLRIGNNKSEYKTWYLSKKEYSLDDVKKFRNMKVKEMEDIGLRSKKGCTSYNTLIREKDCT